MKHSAFASVPLLLEKLLESLAQLIEDARSEGPHIHRDRLIAREPGYLASGSVFRAPLPSRSILVSSTMLSSVAVG